MENAYEVKVYGLGKLLDEGSFEAETPRNAMMEALHNLINAHGTDYSEADIEYFLKNATERYIGANSFKFSNGFIDIFVDKI
jgi:hypothetical protein